MIEALAGLFGLLFGSFLNVCIYRWPRDLSVVKPRSRCPGCAAPVASYDNIPLLSWLLLRGRCRRCGVPISWRYPVVELATALSFAYFVSVYGVNAAAARSCVLAALLIALIFCDLETRLLPDQFTLGGIVLGLAFALLTPAPDSIARFLLRALGGHPGPRLASLSESLLGAIVPAGTLWLTGWLFEKIRHREGLGFGDVKMLAAIGAFLGLRATLFTLVAGSLLGSVIGLAYIRLSGKEAAEYELPFATFLGVGGLLALTVGRAAMDWYAGFY